MISKTKLMAACADELINYEFDKLVEMKNLANNIFDLQERQRGVVESPTTPPVYKDSWTVEKQAGLKLILINEDSGAMWVEFGAHAGGKTKVLGYRPLGKAMDLMEVDDVG